ncbi:MAG TPA: calcium-binding protein [Solirubrobacterales bacterium]|nr:calcium-binding protein [Solirubrobacterales bacterium]
MAALLLALALALPASAGAAESSPLAMPSCAEGPATVGNTTYGTPCDDVIVAPAAVDAVKGGGGDDTILGSVTTAASGSPETGLHLEVGSQTFEGGPGNDIVYGDRGNDTLRGNGGNDRLYGGIGDDVLEGGEGDDLLAGGFGADKIDGQAGNDYVRGDTTIDHIFDSGGGFDTLSFSTGVTPGFTAESNPTGAAGFPGPDEERGIWLELGEGGSNAIDGEPSLGGGNDEIQPGVFERIIGTPFSDYIVGSSADEQIYGGGGADAIKGEGGDDKLNGGADGDYLDGGSGSNTIEAGAGDNCFNPTVGGCGSTAAVKLRKTSEISVGETTGSSGTTQIYVVGSESSDTITASYNGSSVTVSIPGGSFNADADGCSFSTTTASCPLTAPLDSIVLAGMGGNDTITAQNFPDGVGLVAIGGAGEDTLTGGVAEDILVDGPGDIHDILSAGAGDDALTHNGGPDLLDGGEGSDLFLSVSICDSETISGGAAGANDRDNASWARLSGIGVDARLDLGRVGEIGASEEPQCPGGSFDALTGIEDLEASNQSDVLYGDEGANQLLGHKGEDTYHARGGNDSILANSGSRDRVIDCGPGLDQATIDFASIGDPTPIECERVREGAAEEFNELELLTEPPPPPPPPPPDRRPPRTKLLRHPAKVLRVAPGRRKLVAFRFAASEPSTFECKLDRKPYKPCRSPRAFRVGIGPHSLRIFAIDAAGNRDPTPALFKFRVVALKRHRVKQAAR